MAENAEYEECTPCTLFHRLRNRTGLPLESLIAGRSHRPLVQATQADGPVSKITKVTIIVSGAGEGEKERLAGQSFYLEREIERLGERKREGSRR